MKIAAIDLGSNSLHMVIVEVGRSGGFQVIDREKNMVRLGSGISRGLLPADSMRRALQVLEHYKRLAETRRVDKLIAVATSAVREARNGGEFLRRVHRQTGIWVRTISGADEGRLIYLAALHSVRLEGKRALVMDFGGGSVELAVGAGDSLDLAISEKLGVLRLRDRFVRADPLDPTDERRMVEHIRKEMERHVRRIKESGFERAIGTSGTILALGVLASILETGRRSEALHHTVLRAESIRAVRKQLVGMDLKGRMKLPGMDPERADVIHAGAVVVDTILSLLGVEELFLSEWALREGILLDYIHGHPRSVARAEAYPDVRRRSVIDLAERCLFDDAHARHVAALSLSLFDATRAIHEMGDEERALLEYSALLHDIGHHISHARHHKHSYYLIKHGDLRGFHPEEIEIIANVARYHRRGLPKKKHPAFGALSSPIRQKVRVLAGMLRVADALDRSHLQQVRSVALRRRPGRARIVCEVTGDAELEFWGARRRVDLLEEFLHVRLDVGTPADAPHARAETLRLKRSG